jgi:hypothetical protein
MYTTNYNFIPAQTKQVTSYSKTWLIRKSVIQNFAIIHFLFELMSQGGKIHTNLPDYFKNLDNL